MQSSKINSCFIVASGPSAIGFNPPPGIPVIVVNDVIKWISRADYWITIDGTRKNLKNTKRHIGGTAFFAAIPVKYELPQHVTRLQRISAPGLSENPYIIHSGNSAFAALGLAYHLGAKKVALVGVDGTKEMRVDGGYSDDLTHLPALFESAFGQIQMVNCGKLASSIIPKMTKSEAAQWLRG